MLILQESHEVVLFVSLRTHDDQNNDYSKLVRIIRLCIQYLRNIDDVGSKLMSTKKN